VAQQIVNNNIDELEKEMLAFGRPIGDDAGSQLYQVLEMSRAFYDNFQDHLGRAQAGGSASPPSSRTSCPPRS